LQTRKFTVDQGSVSFEGTLDPVISLRADSVIRQVGDEDVEVTVTAQGPLRKPTLTLSSNPSYSERELASLIATGRRGLALDSSAWVAGEQAAALLAGRLTRNLARGLLDLGLDEVDLQPELLAREADPGARFTFGKNLTPHAKLVYSVGLNDPEATYFLGEYRVRVGAEATARVQRDDDGEYTYGLGQRFRLGGPERRGRGPRTGLRTELSGVDLVGQLGLPEAELRKAVHAEPGDDVSPWELQEDVDRLEQKLVSAGHLEALVSARTEEKVARFEVEAGPRYRAEVHGLEDPPDLSSLLREVRFEGEASTRGRERLLEEASSRGFPYARVDTHVVDEGDEKAIRFEVDLGRPIARTEVLFPGARALSRRRLLEASGGAAAMLREPEAARRRVREEYRRAHHLAAEVDAPRVEETPDGRGLTVSIPVTEGPRANVASFRFEGGTTAEADLRSLAGLDVSRPFDPQALPLAVERIRDFYLKKGFASVRVAPRLVPSGPDYDVVFDVVEGETRSIGSIVVSGQRRTRESVIRSRIGFRTGEPLDPRRLVVAERRILELNVFSRVAVTASEDEPATVSVEVVERGPYTVAYDVRYNDADRLSGALDAEVGNLGGYALAVGARYRQGSDLRETRASLSLPVLGRTRGFLATTFRQEEDFLLVREGVGDAPPPPAFRDTERQQGFELQQAMKLGNKWDALYGYRFRRVSSLATGYEQDVSSFGVALLRETRDNPLDARRGRFWSLSFDLAPKQLGSDLAFFRGYGQGFFIRALSPSWTWAQAYRLGLANGLREKQGEQVQIVGKATELFRAGGASSLRGFATDSVGPRGPVTGLSRGGEAVIVLNQEIRFHHPSGFGAAAFYDVGNVYARIGDIDFNLRHSLGLGIRYASPIGLVRVDFGFPLDRRPGERSYQWFFTLGQAF
jgi:outer membrane protein insertion porin family